MIPGKRKRPRVFVVSTRQLSYQAGTRHVIDVSAASVKAAHGGSLVITRRAEQLTSAPDRFHYVRPNTILVLAYFRTVSV